MTLPPLLPLFLSTSLDMKPVKAMTIPLPSSPSHLLLGRGWTTTDTLRPLAISSIADFVIAPRSDLTPAQLTRTVHFFLRYLKVC
jgi:hypothetical protein